MIRELNISLTPEEAADHASLERAAARKLKISRDAVTAVRIRRKSIDARRREVRINLSIAVFIPLVAADKFLCAVKAARFVLIVIEAIV